MADLQALREAEAVVQAAADLEDRAGREITALQEARAAAQEGLRRIEVTGRAAIQHLSEMGRDLREGRRLQQAAAASLDLGAAAAGELWRAGLAPRLCSLPALASPAHVPARGVVVLGETPLPDFRAPDPEALRSLPVPSPQADVATWDLFAQGVPSFLDHFDKSLEPLFDTGAEFGSPQPASRRSEPGEREKETER